METVSLLNGQCLFWMASCFIFGDFLSALISSQHTFQVFRILKSKPQTHGLYPSLQHVWPQLYPSWSSVQKVFLTVSVHFPAHWPFESFWPHTWRRKWQPTPVFLPRESHGQRSLAGCVCGVTQSRTRLKRLSSSSTPHPAPSPLFISAPTKWASMVFNAKDVFLLSFDPISWAELDIDRYSLKYSVFLTYPYIFLVNISIFLLYLF